MLRIKVLMAVFGVTMLLGTFTANALCTGCVSVQRHDFDDPWTTYSGVVTYITWYTNEHGQHTHRVNYLTLTGDTMAYCQQQVNAALATPGTSLHQHCQAD